MKLKVKVVCFGFGLFCLKSAKCSNKSLQGASLGMLFFAETLRENKDF